MEGRGALQWVLKQGQCECGLVVFVRCVAGCPEPLLTLLTAMNASLIPLRLLLLAHISPFCHVHLC